MSGFMLGCQHHKSGTIRQLVPPDGKDPKSSLKESCKKWVKKTIKSPVQFSHVWFFETPWTARLPCPSPTLGACSNSCPSSWWRHPTISSSVVPFSSCLQSLPASGSFPMSQFFTSGGQSTGTSTSLDELPIYRNFKGQRGMADNTMGMQLANPGLQETYQTNNTAPSTDNWQEYKKKARGIFILKKHSN